MTEVVNFQVFHKQSDKKGYLIMLSKYSAEIFGDILNKNSILTDEMMKKHTTYKIGGACDVMLLPENEEQVVKIVKLCDENKIPLFVVGNGSNLLVKDGGIRGVVMKIASKMSDIRVEGNHMYVQAGALLGSAVKTAYENSLSGLEFAIGIPGAVGGAVTMNAGAYGGHMQQIVKKARVCDRCGNVTEICGDAFDFGYRQSVVRDKSLIVLSCELELEHSERSQIKEKMDLLSAKRRSMQPLSLPSCGSVFKRPEGHYIGKLIEDAGLKGTTVGGAQVSTLHANFIVNVDNAKAKDVLDLIEVVKAKVLETFDIPIETEVIVIGEDQ